MRHGQQHQPQSSLAQMSNWANNLSNFWAAVVFVFPAVGAAVTAWLARIETVPVPWHLVIFYASGVFCFLFIAATSAIKSGWDFTLKHKLTCDDFSIQLFVYSGKLGIMLNGLHPVPQTPS
jgi:hypothetical protein